jgi:hypothetical protein
MFESKLVIVGGKRRIAEVFGVRVFGSVSGVYYIFKFVPNDGRLRSFCHFILGEVVQRVAPLANSRVSKAQQTF